MIHAAVPAGDGTNRPGEARSARAILGDGQVGLILDVKGIFGGRSDV